MKERLIIKNFGPIESVELELGRFNVIIGEQGTGKSAIARLLNLLRFDFFIKDVYNNKTEIKDWLKDYDIDHFFTDKTLVEYDTEYFSIKLKEKAKIEILDEKFKQLLNTETFLLNELGKLDIPNEKLKHINISKSISENDKLLGKFIGEVSFVPTERMLLAYLSVSAFSLNKVIETLPNYIRNAGTEFEVFKVRFEQDKLNIDLKSILDSDVLFYYKNNIARIKKEDKDFELIQAESGIQSLVPLLTNFKVYKDYYRLWTFIVEEPELNLFPTTQYNLIKYIFSSVSERKDRNLIITTHSPYILTSLNNLMYAYQVGQEHAEEVDKIIERKYWVNPDDVSAYRLMTDGTAKNILDSELKQIDAGELDGISRSINDIWDRIANIEFSTSDEN